MTREIKFRVWDKEKSEMFFVEDIYWAEVDESITNINGWNNENPLMQFTGLKDKNGKEIYEGDIVIKKLVKNNRIITIGSFQPFVVEWNYCGFNLNF